MPALWAFMKDFFGISVFLEFNETGFNILKTLQFMKQGLKHNFASLG